MIFRVQSTAWLLAHELRLARRTLTSRKGMKWRAPVLIGAFILAGVLVGGPAAFALRFLSTPLPPIFSILADVVVLAVFTLMLSQTLAAATEALYARGDLDLLFSSPIAPRKVLFVRCAAIAANAFIAFAILVSPLAIPVGLFARPAWLAVYPVLAALALLATSCGLAIAIGLFRLIGPKRTRTVSQILAVFIGAGIFLVAQSRNFVGQARFNQWMSTFATGGGHLTADGPLSWPLRVLTGEPGPLLVVLGLTVAVFAGVTTWVGRRFASDAAAASGAAVGGAKQRGGDGPFAGGVFRVTFRKELRLLRRDVPLLAQVLLRVVYLLPLTFILLRNAGGHVTAQLPMGVGVVSLMCGQVAGSLVWLTVAAEDAPELIGCAPSPAAAISRAKLCAALAPLAVLMTLPLLAVLLLSPLAGIVAIAGCVASALASAMIGFSLQKPAKRSAFRRRGSGSLVATLAEFTAGAIIALTTGVAVVWPPLIVAPITAAALAGWLLWRTAGPRLDPLPKASLVVQ